MLAFNFNVRVSEIKRSGNFAVGQTNVGSKVVDHDGFLSTSGRIGDAS
jgi:hypothetical protein